MLSITKPIVPITVTCESALLMLAQLEVYAGNCLAVTQSHKAAVAAMQTIDEIESYDYKSGYPAILEFKL